MDAQWLGCNGCGLVNLSQLKAGGVFWRFGARDFFELFVVFFFGGALFVFLAIFFWRELVKTLFFSWKMEDQKRVLVIL